MNKPLTAAELTKCLELAFETLKDSDGSGPVAPKPDEVVACAEQYAKFITRTFHYEVSDKVSSHLHQTEYPQSP